MVLSSTPAARAAKSNRAQGDLFELLLLRAVVLGLRADGHGVKFAHKKELDALVASVTAAHGDAAHGRLAQQYRACEAAAPVVLRLLRERATRHGTVTTAFWHGRETGRSVAATDLEVIHAHGATKLSVKSTVSGAGTLKNFGGRSLLALLDVDVPDLDRQMDARVLEALRDHGGPARAEALSPLGREGRRRALSEAEREHARDAAYPVLERVAAELLARLRDAPQEVLARFVAYGLALPQGHDPDLFTIVVNRDGAYLAPPSGVPVGTFSATRATSITNVVTCNGVALLRVVVSCTNGIGLSALCARTFEVPPPPGLPGAGEPVEVTAPVPSLEELLARAESLAEEAVRASGGDARSTELLQLLRSAQAAAPPADAPAVATAQRPTRVAGSGL